jgi:hypothetical protein
MAKPPEKPPATRVGPQSGLARFTARLRPDQIAKLYAEARERAERAGRFRADASEIIRDALDAWFAGRRKP